MVLSSPNVQSVYTYMYIYIYAASIDTSVFTAHSEQVALFLAAANLGVITNDILKAADWSLLQTN